jgi:hypothetical protein
MSQRAELRETWRAAMSAAGGAQRASTREREPLRGGLFRRTSGRAPEQAPEVSATGYVSFFPGEDGYRLRDAAGPCPAVGEELDQDGRSYLVLKVGSSPFPNDARPCAYLERCGPPEQLAFDLAASGKQTRPNVASFRVRRPDQQARGGLTVTDAGAPALRAY